MMNNSRSRLVSLLALILVLVMAVSTLGVISFAHDGEDHDHEEESAPADTNTETKEDGFFKKLNKGWHKAGAAFKKWCESTVGQIVGYCVSGVVLAGIVVCIVLWIPKKDSKDKKRAKQIAKKSGIK